MKKNTASTILAVLLCCQLSGVVQVSACINTSYSHKHEVQITGELIKIIMGEFPEHGPAFYASEMRRTDSLLEKDPMDVEARNDRAAALIKLTRFPEAEAEFLRIDREFPGRYKTHANLGVLYKKTGEFAKTVQHTERALEIQPEGHLGIGDYYLRMLRWREQLADTQQVPTENFLGIAYAKGPEAVRESPLVNQEYLRTLIIADRHFPDTYLILGDLLFAEGDFELAYRCYHRADALWKDRPKSPQKTFFQNLYRNRQNDVEDAWEERAKNFLGIGPDAEVRHEILKSEDHLVTQWMKNFQRIEAELISEKTAVDFDVVIREMKSRGLKDPRYVEMWDGESSLARFRWITVAVVMFYGLLLTGLVVLLTLAVRYLGGYLGSRKSSQSATTRPTS